MPEPVFHFYVYEILPAYKPGEEDKHVFLRETTSLPTAMKAIKQAKFEVRCRCTHEDRTREFCVMRYNDRETERAKVEGHRIHPWWGLEEYVASTTKLWKADPDNRPRPRKKTKKKTKTQRRKKLAVA